MKSRVKRERVISTLLDLCRIPSPSGEEEQVRAYIRNTAEELGLDCDEDARGNLYVQTPNTRASLEPLLLCSHMDTVPVPTSAPISVERHGGIIRSNRSTVLGGDDKQGVAAGLEMLRLVADDPGRSRPIDAVFTVEEELGSLGSRDLEVARMRATHGFNLDGETAPGTAIHAAPRKARFTVTVRGRSSHAALDPAAGIHAIKVAADIVRALPLGALSSSATTNVGTISGGSQTNVVPDLTTLTGEIRSSKESEFETLRDSVEDAAHTTAAQWGAEAHVDWEETYGGYEIGEEEAPVRWFAKACRDRGIEPELLHSKGGGDANQLNNLGLRCIVFGLGMHNIHSVNEYVDEEEYLTAVELLATVLSP